MNSATEIRKLPRSYVRELARILESNDSWKKLMDSIPKVLENDNYECRITRNNLHKYRSEHFKLIELESKITGKTCTEILFDEWGTSGRVRPALGHLLFLLARVELFRAADYVAVDVLNMDPPARPTDGPAAPVTIPLSELEDFRLQEVEKILDEINYPDSVISHLISNSYDVNLNQSTTDVHVIPKIVVSEIADNRFNSSVAIPLVTENRRRRMNRQDASVVDTSDESGNTVSDMIKFSQSQTIDDSNTFTNNSNIAPNFSALMSSISSSQSESGNSNISTGDCNVNDLPALSALNVTTNTDNVESQENVPAFSELLSGSVPQLSALLESNVKSNNNYSNTSIFSANPQLPNLSALNVDQQSALLPQMSALISNSSDEIPPSRQPQVTINVIQSEESSPIPQLSALLPDDKNNSCSSKHFLPIMDHLSDIPSDMSSFASSKNSNASSEVSQNSNVSRSSRPMCTSPLPNLSLNTQLPYFTYLEIEAATNNFDETPHKNCRQVENPLAKTNGRFLGSGAFGSVYLALDIVDKPVAVKKLVLNNADVVNIDDPVTKQFRNEVEVLSKYKHENLLSLIGYSCDGPTYCLLYEFLPGGALKDRLQNMEEKLIWTDRLYIALGTARAVSYLHTAYSTPLIHRDIKTANILLDCMSKPKLCDFGLIKLIPNQNTNASTTPFGTSAYMAPEAFRGDVSVKSDTFSFGVVLLELITGLPPLDENRVGRDIVTHIEEVCEDNSGIGPLIDAKAGTWVANNINFAEELYNISCRCLEEKKKRPTMVEITTNLAYKLAYV